MVQVLYTLVFCPSFELKFYQRFNEFVGWPNMPHASLLFWIFCTFRNPFYTFLVSLLADRQCADGWRSWRNDSAIHMGLHVVNDLVEIVRQSPHCTSSDLVKFLNCWNNTSMGRIRILVIRNSGQLGYTKISSPNHDRERLQIVKLVLGR